MSKSSRYTPMLRQYLEVKAEHQDAVLLYRMGDFYELFFDDAEKAAPILEVALTARNRGTENEAPMCGVPHHALDVYLAKLLKSGLKVAICDQVEDPATAKGLVKREVTRVVTPGTVSDPGILEGKEDNFLASLVWNGEQGGGAFLDVSTGSFFVRRWHRPQDTVEDLATLRPREVLVQAGQVPALVQQWIEQQGVCSTLGSEEHFMPMGRAADLVQRQLGAKTLRGFGLENDEPMVQAAAAALAYARETQRSDLSHIRQLRVQQSQDAMVLDSTTLANLEVFRNQREGGRGGTLLSVLDRTASPPGGRLLREWLRRPLKEPAEIEERHEAVAELLQDEERRHRLREHLSKFGDPERLLSRAVLGSMSPREAAALRDGLGQVPVIAEELAAARSGVLHSIGEVDRAEELTSELERVLEASPPASFKDGGVVRAQVDEELDRVRSLARDSKQHILSMESRERESSNIATLKIRYNRVFGYYIEVTKANQHLVPDHYTRKQTLVNAERYVTPELKELEEQILAAQEEQIRLEIMHFERLREAIVESGPVLRAIAGAIGSLDVLVSLAEVAARNRYVRPQVTAGGGRISIREGRHPVVELAGSEPFVPNDADLDGEEAQIVILTGPNMGGKSTYLRQVALIVLMAQVGSFVPAREATIGTADRIFTRVGASDDLSRGESTFMVEMIETAKILHQSTAESLVILDEVGRGTATFDGLSLAWAIVEHLHEHGRPLTLFATHYHELTELSSLLARVVNRTMAVKEWNDQIVFLRRVIAGSSDKSYGLHVARLAGIPNTVIERAAEVLNNLEEQEYDLSGKPRLARGHPPTDESPDQMTLFAPAEQVVASLLREVDLERLSPLAALNLLQSLKSRL
jgi:DNA mismatch repair protein MutS